MGMASWYSMMEDGLSGGPGDLDEDSIFGDIDDGSEKEVARRESLREELIRRIRDTEDAIYVDDEADPANDNEKCLFVLEHFLQECGVELVASRFDEFEVEVTFLLHGRKRTFRWKSDEEIYEMFEPELMIDGVAYGPCRSFSVPHEPIDVLKAWLKELIGRFA